MPGLVLPGIFMSVVALVSVILIYQRSSTRSYRKKLPLDYIAQEIETYAGTQFDPEVANAFLSLYEEGAFDNLRDTEEL